MIVTRQSLSYGFRFGIATALGIQAGTLIHIIYSLIGLSFAAAKFTHALSIIKYIGAAYLIYLGFKSFSSSAKLEETKSSDNNKISTNSLLNSFRLGLLTNLLNPKATLFIVSIFSLVIHPETTFQIKLFYSTWMLFLSFTWFIFISISFSRYGLQSLFAKYNKFIHKLFGIILIIFGIELLFLVH